MYAGIGVYVYMFIHEWLKQRLQLYKTIINRPYITTTVTQINYHS